MTTLPTLFLDRLQKIFNAQQFENYLTSLNQAKVTSFRVNTLKINSSQLLDKLKGQNIPVTPITWCDNAFYVTPNFREQLTYTEEFKSGLLYIQNQSSLFASLVLNPSPGEEVLDLAAAPGGKTLHLANLMHNKGRIAAVEPVRDRFFRLKRNIESAGANLVQAYCKDGATIGRLVPQRFDRVLLDAPCSSEGRFELQQPESFAYWSAKKISEMARKQKQLIYSAVQSLKPNGILVYCTCSYAPEENEAIIDYALRKFQQLEILPIQVPFQNFASGLSNFENHTFDDRITQAIRIIPNTYMNGFFICKLRKL